MRFGSSIEYQYKWRDKKISPEVRHIIHQRRMVQSKFHYNYFKYERYDREISRYDDFKGRNGINS